MIKMAQRDPRSKLRRRKPWAELSVSYKAALQHKKVMARAEPGGGERFASLASKLKGRVKSPGAVAAYIGRKKYGKKRFQEMAARGRKRKR